MTNVYKFQLDNLTGEEMTELRRLRDIRFLRTEQKNTHPKFEYNVLVEVIPTTPEHDSKVIQYLTSMTLPGKDHGPDRYSSEYKLLKEELGILPPTLPSTLSDAVNEFEDKLEYEMLKENLGLKDFTND
tara:strand:- start:662 stop:1048 length:387 start_codon:yes stop_codon:yes gene_type:complete